MDAFVGFHCFLCGLRRVFSQPAHLMMRARSTSLVDTTLPFDIRHTTCVCSNRDWTMNRDSAFGRRTWWGVCYGIRQLRLAHFSSALCYSLHAGYPFHELAVSIVSLKTYPTYASSSKMAFLATVVSLLTFRRRMTSLPTC